MSSPTAPRSRWLPRSLRKTPASPVRRPSRLGFEPLEARDVPAIIAMSFNGAFTATEGTNTGAAVPIANFTTNNYSTGQDQSGQLTAEVLWGDGTVSAGFGNPTVVFATDLGGGQARYNVFASHTYTAASVAGNPYTLTLRVNDGTNQGTVSAATTLFNVADRPLTPNAPQPAITATAGAPLTDVVVARFVDANPFSTPDQLAATVTWGNPFEQVAGVIVREGPVAGGVQYSVVSSHTFTTAGSTLVGVSVTGQQTSFSVSNPVTVNQGSIVPTAIPVTLTEGATSIPANTPLGTFVDQGGGQPVANYANSFVQFPGAGAVAVSITRNTPTGNTYTVSTGASPILLAAPARVGNYNYQLRIQDNTGNTGVTFGSLVVTNAPIVNVFGGTVAPPTEGQAVAFTNLLAFTDTNPTPGLAGLAAGEYEAVIDWGDGSPQSAGTVTYTGPGAPPGSSAFRVDGTHTYTRRTGPANQDKITVTVTDSAGQRVSATTNTFTVLDAALAAGTAIPVVGAAGQELNEVPVATFTDTNLYGLSTDLVASIDWGDGTPATQGSITLVGRSVGGGSQFLVTGTHTYASASPALGGPQFTTRVTVTDVGTAPNPALGGAITGTATIAPSAIPVTVFPLAAQAGTPLAFPNPIATFPNVTGVNTPASYAVTVNWGDGTTQAFGAGVGVVYNLATNSFTFTPTGTHLYAKPGLYPVTVTVAGPNGWTGTGASSAVVSAAAFAASPAAPLSPTEGAPLPASTAVATFTVSDPLAAASGFTATIDWGDGSPQSAGTITATGPGAFTVTGGHTYAHYNAGPLAVIVTVRDAYGNAASTQTTVTKVADAALSNGVGTAVVGAAGQQLVNVPIGTFVDANPLATAADHAVTITWGDLTSSAGTVTLIGRSGAGALFAVTGSHVYAATTGGVPLPVVATVTDAGGSTVTINTTATITQTLIAVSVLPQAGSAGSLLVPTSPLAVFEDGNGNAAPGVYAAVVNWGDGSSDTFPAGAGISFNPLTDRFSFTLPAAGHTYARPGAYPLTVSITGPNGRLGVGASSAVLVPAVLTAAGVPGGITTAVEGAPLPGGTTVATFTVADQVVGAAGFTATINWGDGSPETTGTVVQTGPGAFRVTGGHTYTKYTAAGFTATVTVRDAYGDASVATTTVAPVAEAGLAGPTGVPVVGNTGAQLTNVTVGTFVDNNPFGTAADHTAVITWGDTTTSAGQVVLVGRSGAGLLFAVTGTHTYQTTASAPPFAIAATVTEPNGTTTVTINTTATITQTPIPVSVYSQNGPAGNPLVLTAPLAVFTDENGAGLPAAYSATVNWGDGSSTTFGAGVGITYDAAGNRFSFTPPAANFHTYAKPGVYPITVTVNGPDDRLGVAAATAVVTPPSFVGGVVAGPDINVNEGTPIPATTTLATFTVADPAAVATGFIATIDWGDGSPFSMGQVTLTGTTATTASFKVTGGHTYTEAGAYTIIVRVADAFGGGGAATLTANVADAPLINPRGITATGTVRQPLVNVTLGVFTDANPFAPVSDFTATIDWNDPLAPGADPIGLVSPVGGNATGATFAVAGNHVYGRAGTYPVSITVVDDDGQTTTINTTVTVLAVVLTGQANPVLATEGLPTPAGLAVASFASPGAVDPTVYTVTVNWGDNSSNDTTTGVTVTSAGGGNFVVHAPAHTYAEEGPYVVTVTVAGTDGSGPLALTGLATVQDAALTGINGVVVVNEAAPYAATPAAPLVSFTDANPGATTADFLATIDWGDGTSMIGSVAQPGGAGTAFGVLGSHTYPDSGAYTATVVVTDVGGQRAVVRAAVTVNNVAPTAAMLNSGPVDENSPVTVSFVNAYDPSPADTAAGFRYSFALTPANLAVTYLAAGTPTSATFTFPDGPLTPTVYGRVFDKDGGFTDYSTTVTVRNVAPTATLTTAGVNLPNKPVTVSLVNATDPSPVDAASLTYSFDLGTGTFSAPTASPSASFTPKKAGTYAVRARVIDKDGAFTEYAQSVVIKDPTIYAVGAGEGGAPLIKVFTPAGVEVASFFAYDPNFRGGVNVAVGDVNGDGVPDVIAGTGPGGGPHVKVFDGRDFTVLAQFMATNPAFRGGVHVATGDVDGDGTDDVITGAGNGGGPQVQVFRGGDFAMTKSFFAYDPSVRGGVNVAAADTDGDGKADIVTGAGVGGAPHVKVFDAVTLAERLSFYAFEPTQTGGVNVAAGDIDGDGVVEIVTAPGMGGGSRLRTFNGQTAAAELSVYAFGPDRVTGQPLRNGMTVAVTGLTSARGPIVVAGSGPGYSSLVTVRDGKTLDELTTTIPFLDGDPNFNGGIFIG